MPFWALIPVPVTHAFQLGRSKYLQVCHIWKFTDNIQRILFSKKQRTNKDQREINYSDNVDISISIR